MCRKDYFAYLNNSLRGFCQDFIDGVDVRFGGSRQDIGAGPVGDDGLVFELDLDGDLAQGVFTAGDRLDGIIE